MTKFWLCVQLMHQSYSFSSTRTRGDASYASCACSILRTRQLSLSASLSSSMKNARGASTKSARSAHVTAPSTRTKPTSAGSMLFTGIWLARITCIYVPKSSDDFLEETAYTLSGISSDRPGYLRRCA